MKPTFPETEKRPALQLVVVVLNGSPSREISLLTEVRLLRDQVERLYLAVKSQTPGATDKVETVMALAAEVFAPDCAHWRIWMTSAVRTEPRVIARMAAQKICHENLGIPLVHVGERFNRDHTSISNAIRSTANRCECDPKFRAQYEALEARVRAAISK